MCAHVKTYVSLGSKPLLNDLELHFVGADMQDEAEGLVQLQMIFVNSRSCLEIPTMTWYPAVIT